MNTSKSLIISVVSPCYNESEILPTSIPRLVAFIDNLIQNHSCSHDSYIVLVDDGSTDNTWDQISDATANYPGRIRGLRLSRNVGHQNALMAGLSYVTERCDAVISIDADLQDDLDVLPQMIDKHRAGSEMVLGIKLSRIGDTVFKKISASGFYKIMQWMGVDLVKDHADCRLMSAKALKNLSKYPESTLFLRGLQPLLHTRISTVEYHIGERLAGESKYSLQKMLGLALNGITSFSVMPLRLITATGAIVFTVSMAFALYAFWHALKGHALPGWASITIPLYLLGGLLMLSMGIIGEYVGKIFLEVKNRPRFLIDEIAGDSDDMSDKSSKLISSS